MRTLLIATAVIALGCRPSSGGDLQIPDETIRRSAESKIWITGPIEGAPFSPGESFTCQGKFTIAEADRPYSLPKVSLLSVKVTLDRARPKQGDQGEGVEVPFEAKFTCPKQPGAYLLRASMSVATKAKDDKGNPRREFAIVSKPIEVKVREQKTKK